MFEIGDIIQRNPNREPTDPPDSIFKNGNSLFLIVDIILKQKSKFFVIRSLKVNEILYTTLYNRNKLWTKIA